MSKKAVVVVVFFGLLGSLWWCSETAVCLEQNPAPAESSPRKGVVRLPDAACEAAGLKLQEVNFKRCDSALKAMGKILAPQPQTAILSYAYAGRMAEIRVKVGDWVEKGQPLVTLESQAVGEAMAEFYKAVANYGLAKLNFEREERLLKEGIGLKKNFVAAEAECKVAQANSEAAEKSLHVLGFTEEEVEKIANTHQISPRITLYAPIAGKVIEIKTVLGSMVDPSTEILTIIDPRLLWVDAEIYEKDIAKVKVEQTAEITVPAYPGQVFRGKLIYVADVVDEQTRTITVRSEVANDDCRLKPGMFAAVRILLDQSRRMLVVPLGAVLEEGDRKVVFVKEGGHFVRREVEIGPVDGNDQVIIKGLKLGETVVIEGNHQLRSVLHEDVLEAAHTH